MYQRRPPIYLPTNCMVLVAAHTSCRGEPLVDDERKRIHFLARPNTKEHMQPLCNACSVPLGVPKPTMCLFRPVCVSVHCPMGTQFCRVVASSVFFSLHYLMHYSGLHNVRETYSVKKMKTVEDFLGAKAVA